MKNILRMYYPSSWWGAGWRDALPAGNGRIGAAVYGAVGEETIMLSHEQLWSNSVSPELPDVSGRLADVRRLLNNHQPELAAKVFRDAFESEGYEPSIGLPFPLGDLKISQRGDSAFREYERRLNMETGEIFVEWLDGENRLTRRLFVSRTDNIIVLELCSSIPGSVSASFSLGLHKSDMFSQDCSEDVSSGETLVKIEDGFLSFSAGNSDTGEFGAVVRCISSGGSMLCGDEHLDVRNADSILLLTGLFPDGNSEEERLKLIGKLSGLSGDYEQLFAGHVSEHRRLFMSVEINLDSEKESLSESSNEELLLHAYRGKLSRTLLEKFWAFGRYLLISGAYEEGLPLPLHGLWTGEWNPFWGFHMVNENLQMIYWQAYQGNLTSLVLPVFDYFESLLDDFRENAKKIYGCRGIFVPAPTAPDSGLLKTPVPHIIHWTGGAGWIAQLYFDYFLFTGDKIFLENRAFPFIREAARFYEDFFTIGEDGFFVSSPSNSPENTPGNFWDGEGMSEKMETTMNASMDFAIAREVFSHLIESLVILGGDQGDVDHWKLLLQKIPGYQINEDGAVKEWMHPDFMDNYHHRHLSHLYPVFPGTELVEKDNSELFKAFTTAVDKRFEIGMREQSAWSLTHMANIFARVGNGERALESLEIFSRTAVAGSLLSMGSDWRNMGTSVNIPWAPFQIDANMGFSSAVQEMLLYSRPGLIKLLPALPENWKKGSFRNMLCRGQVAVSLEWNLENRLITGDFLSSSSQEVTVKFPDDVAWFECSSGSDGFPGSCYRKIVLSAGKPAVFKAGLSESHSE